MRGHRSFFVLTLGILSSKTPVVKEFFKIFSTKAAEKYLYTIITPCGIISQDVPGYGTWIKLHTDIAHGVLQQESETGLFFDKMRGLVFVMSF